MEQSALGIGCHAYMVMDIAELIEMQLANGPKLTLHLGFKLEWSQITSLIIVYSTVYSGADQI